MKIKLTGRNFLLASGLLFIWLFSVSAPGYTQPADQEGVAQNQTSSDTESPLLSGLSFIPAEDRDRWLELVNNPASEPYGEFMSEGELVIRALGELSAITGGEIPNEDDEGGDTYASLREQLLSVMDSVENKISTEESDQQEEEAVESVTETNDQPIETVDDPPANDDEKEDEVVEESEDSPEQSTEVEEQTDDSAETDEQDTEVEESTEETVEQPAEPGIEEIEAMLLERSVEREDISQEIKDYRRELIQKGLEILREQTSNEENLTDPARRDAIAGLYFRFTELSYQEEYDRFLEETGNYIDEMNRLAETDPAAAGRLVPPEPDYSRIMVMYQKVVDEYPTSEYADDALYNIGVLTSESPREIDRTNANRIFETLISIYPESNYVLNSLRRIGDYYFQPPINDLESAALAFNQILQKFPESKYYQEALYKLGWTYYRMSDLPMAVEYFASVLDISFSGEEGGLDEGTLLDIANESVNYLGICYAIDPAEWDGAGVDNLAIWLDNNPVRKERYGADVMMQLGDIFNKQLGRYMMAAETYYKFLEIFPINDRAPEVQAKIVDLYQEGNIFDVEQAQIEKINFFTSYNPDSEWWRLNEDPATRKKVIPLLEKTLDMIIDELLVQATDTRDREKYKEYVKYSREYLRFWPEGPNAYKILYKLASVLENRLNEPMLAMREYWQIATAYDDTTYREIAAGRVVALAQNFVKREESGRIYVSDDGDIMSPLEATTEPDSVTDESVPVDTTEVISPTELLNSQRLLLAAYDKFIELFPTSNLCPDMLLRASDMLFEHNQFAESRVYAYSLINDFPGSEHVGKAYQLVLEGHFQSKEYDKVEEVHAMVQMADVDEELKTSLSTRKAESLFLGAKDLKTSDNHLEAAERFKRVAIETPDYEYADRSLFQAGLEYRLGEAWDEARDVFLMIVDRYPASEYAPKALYNAGYDLQTEIADLSASAEMFENLANNYPESDLTKGALANASANYASIEDHEGVIRVNELFVSLFPTDDDAHIYLFENAEHYLSLGDVDKANEIYQRFSAKFPNNPRTIQANFERGKYFLEQGNVAQASREFNRTVTAHDRMINRGLPGSPKYASQALIQVLEWEHADYDEIQFRLPTSAINATEQEKIAMRNDLTEKYQKLLSLGQKEGYKGFYLMGLLDDELARATYEQEFPEYTAQDQRLQATSELVDKSILLSAVASATYESAIVNLNSIIDQLHTERVNVQNDYDSITETIATMQREDAEGLSDSLSQQRIFGLTLTEIDSSLTIANDVIEVSKVRIPDLAFNRGEYLTRLWDENLLIRGTEDDEEINMLFREEILNSTIVPMAQELCGLFLQANIQAVKYELGDEYNDKVRLVCHNVMEVLVDQYDEQINLTIDRINRYTGHYDEMLPRGEDAQSPDGLYPEEMGTLIQYQYDYFNIFIQDNIFAFASVMDTVVTYELPYGFGEGVYDRIMQFVIDQHNKIKDYSVQATDRLEQYSVNYNDTQDYIWDDASLAFDDISAYLSDYDLELLTEGIRLKTDYDIFGDASVDLMRIAVRENPGEFASAFGIRPERTTEITNTNWRAWNEYVRGFEAMGFSGDDWGNAVLTSLPIGTELGMLDSLGAQPIWFELIAESDTLPDSANGLQGGEEDDFLQMLDEEGESFTTLEQQQALESAELAWQDWIGSDETSTRRYFRKEFYLGAKPTSSQIWITADDDFNLFINGIYIAADNRDEIDFDRVDMFDISQYLVDGMNVIAVGVSDVDETGHGLTAGMIFESIADIGQQLDLIGDKEKERQRALKQMSIAEPTESEMYRLRTVEKNKLR